MLKQVVVLMPLTLQLLYMQKQPSRGVLMKRCSENMQQIYRCSPVNLLHIFKTSFAKNTTGWLLLLYGNKQYLVIQKIG